MAQLDYQFHFYGGVERQLGDTHGRAGVEPGLSEDLTQEIRGPVEHLRLAVEARRRGDVTSYLHDAANVVQPTGLCRGGGEGVEGAEPGRFLSIFEGVTASPTLPVLGSSPPSKGTWPAVKTRVPARVAGT
jgi:hypothetical protein